LVGPSGGRFTGYQNTHPCSQHPFPTPTPSPTPCPGWDNPHPCALAAWTGITTFLQPTPQDPYFTNPHPAFSLLPIPLFRDGCSFGFIRTPAPTRGTQHTAHALPHPLLTQLVGTRAYQHPWFFPTPSLIHRLDSSGWMLAQACTAAQQDSLPSHSPPPYVDLIG